MRRRGARTPLPAQLPVLLEHRRPRPTTSPSISKFADGCIVGSSLKVDGDTWNRVDPGAAPKLFVGQPGAG